MAIAIPNRDEQSVQPIQAVQEAGRQRGGGLRVRQNISLPAADIEVEAAPRRTPPANQFKERVLRGRDGWLIAPAKPKTPGRLKKA